MYYIVNEANPELLILWNEKDGIISEESLGFAIDYSGIYVETEQSHLWFVSDQSKSLYKCDYTAQVIEEYQLSILKFEGVVVEGSIVYLINDATAELYKYQIK